MFEAAKVGRKLSKAAWKQNVPELRTQLLEAQRQAKEAGVPVVVLVAGMEGSGKGEVVNRLTEWLDGRNVQIHAFWDETDEERDRPRNWRFWRALPAAGEIAIMFSGWYLRPIEQRVLDGWDDADLEQELRRIREFERMLIVDGALIVKFWFHFSEKDQRKRLKSLTRDDRSRWKMMPKKAKLSTHYRTFEHTADLVVRRTDIGTAPWYIVEASNARYRDLTTGRTLLRAMQIRLDEGTQDSPEDSHYHSPTPLGEADAQVTVIDKLDLDQSIDADLYRDRLRALQDELNELTWQAYKAKRTVVLVFEGVDAAGKGGAIRRITNAVDARLRRVISIAAPTDEEKAHHYLWRFWRQIPRAGRMTVFDRSWYGRVLVERVEGFTPHKRWRRAYLEINDFEEQLSNHGVIMLKFWLQISKDEQLARFKAREDIAYKRHKITDEDWRNREKWDEYKQAVNEMLIRTSTEHAPWQLIAGNDKRHARIEVLQKVCNRIKSALDAKDKNKSDAA
jgi:polyphosphate:AMP phosphotransferase